MEHAKILTVSDGVVAGTREDRSGQAVEDHLRANGFDIDGKAKPDVVAPGQSVVVAGVNRTGFGRDSVQWFPTPAGSACWAA